MDTIRARITKFGPEVELDERYSHAKFDVIGSKFGPEVQLYERYSHIKFDVTGYFRSPASRHFVNYFSNFSVQYLGNDSTQLHQINWNRRWSSISSTPSSSIMVLAHSVRLYDAKTFSSTPAHISESAQRTLILNVNSLCPLQ